MKKFTLLFILFVWCFVSFHIIYLMQLLCPAIETIPQAILLAFFGVFILLLLSVILYQIYLIFKNL